MLTRCARKLRFRNMLQVCSASLSRQVKSRQVKSGQVFPLRSHSEHGSLARSSGPRPEIRPDRVRGTLGLSTDSVHTGVQASQELFMLDTHSTGEVWSASPWSRRDSGPSRPPAVCGVTFLTTVDTRTSDVIVMYVNVIDGVRSRIGKSEKLYGPATRVLAWRDRDSLKRLSSSDIAPFSARVRLSSSPCAPNCPRDVQVHRIRSSTHVGPP